MEKGPERVKFSSSLSTYLTLLGYSIGSSDIWRFPFLVHRHGGGAFLIPFVIIVVVCGIPMYFLEYSIGKFSGRGPYQLWDICPLFRGLGITISAAYTVYMIGSSIFRCWITEFIIYAFRNPIPWSNCQNDWNTPFCKGNAVLLMAILNDTKSESLSNLRGHDNTTAHGYIISDVTVTTNTTHVLNMSGTSMSAAEEFWQYKVLQLSSGISDLSPVIWKYFLYMFIYRLIVLLGSAKSVKSIEKVIYVTATMPFIVTVAIFIRSLMLPGSGDGIYYFFYPDFDKLSEPRVWIEASLMAFYTLNFGWGVIILLGSHAGFKKNCLRTSIGIPIADMLIAVFSGMVCFSVLGNMAHSHGVHVTEVVNAGMATGMVAYITALTTLPLPQLWTGLFVIAIYMTGVDAQIFPLDMVIHVIGDIFPRVKAGFRIYALIAVSLIMFLLSFFLCTGAGAYIFLWNDWYGGIWVGPIVAFVEIVVVAWIYGMDRFNEDIYMMTEICIPAFLRVGIAFVAPCIVAVMFFTSIVEYLPPRYGSYSYPTLARVMGWLVVAATMMPMFGQAFYTLKKSQETLHKKLRHYVKPLETWGPCEEDKMEEFHEKKSKFSRRTFKDLLHYNVFGTYPASSTMSVITHRELGLLNKTDKLTKNIEI